MRNMWFFSTARRHFVTQDRNCPEGIAHVALVFPEMTSLNRISAAYRKASQSTDGVPRKMADCEGDEMFLASEYEGPVLPWDRFRRWVTCFCVVTFDLELGQALEVSTTNAHASRSAQSWALNAEYLSMWFW